MLDFKEICQIIYWLRRKVYKHYMNVTYLENLLIVLLIFLETFLVPPANATVAHRISAVTTIIFLIVLQR